MKLFSFFLLALTLVSSVHAATYYYNRPYDTYQGDYYRTTTAYSPDGRSFGWDNTFVGEGFARHSSGYIDAGPYKCIGSGCGSTYYLHSSGYYGRGEYYNSKHHPYYWNPEYCTGYWRGGCEHVHRGGFSWDDSFYAKDW